MVECQRASSCAGKATPRGADLSRAGKPFRKLIGKCIRWGWQCFPQASGKGVLLYRLILSPWLGQKYSASLVDGALLWEKHKACPVFTAVARGRRVLREERLLCGIRGSVPAACGHLQSGPGKSRARKGKRENVLPCVARARAPAGANSVHQHLPALAWSTAGQGTSFHPVTTYEWS